MVLINNKVQWTSELMALVSKYGSYEAIPYKEKEAAIMHYKHNDICSALKVGGKAKCIYCESYVDLTCYANIEHYHPKSIYPKESFCWDNLFVGCTLCNIPKSSFDTGRDPFIHPVLEDPEAFLSFDDLQYIPLYKSGPLFEKANNVIKACDLKRLALVQAHAAILVSYLKTCNLLKERLQDFNNHKARHSKQKDLLRIYDAMITLKNEASDDAQYAGFMRYLLRKSSDVRDAVIIINKHRALLGMVTDFDWGFNY